MKNLFVVLLLIIPSVNQAQIFEWSKKISSNQLVEGRNIDVDGNDNLYILGYFGGNQGQAATVEFENFPAASASSTIHGYFAKTDPQGNALWLTKLTSTYSGHIYLSDLRTDAGGTSSIGGWFTDSLIIGSQPYFVRNHTEPRNGFVTKISSSGQVLWTNVLGTATDGEIEIASVAMDRFGDVIGVGTFRDILTINGNTSFTTPGNRYPFIIKWDKNGNLQWVKAFQGIGGGANGSPVTVNVDVSGAIYFEVAGTTNGLSFDGVTIGGHSMLKLTPGGQLIWIRDLSIYGAPSRLKMSQNQDFYGVGTYSGSTTIDGTTYTSSPGKTNMLVYKMDTAGWYKWVRSVNGDFDMLPLGLDVDYQGTLYFVSLVDTSETVYFHDGTTDAGPGYDRGGMLTGFSANGDVVLNSFFPDMEGFPRDLEVKSNGDLYITAIHKNTFLLGGDTIDGTGDSLRYNCFYSSIQIDFNEITGNVFADLNANNQQDSGEVGLSHHFHLQEIDHFLFSQNDGAFTAFTTAGTHTLAPSSKPYYQVVPNSIATTFVGTGNVDSGNVFALQPIANVPDLNTDIVVLNRAVPGRKLIFRLQGKNPGTVGQTPVLKFTHDALLTFSSASIQPTISGNELSWNLGSLVPLDETSINVIFDIPTNASAGDTLLNYQEITPMIGDTTPGDNVDTSRVVIVNAYDPNDKRVVPRESITPDQVAEGLWLTYTIRFQNTGTNQAFNVIIRDTFSHHLDLSTLEILSSSHSHFPNLKGNAMAFEFIGINLPDSNTNEPQSHGFVKYRVKPYKTLKLNDIIENTAHIYFDFNAPIVTNTTYNIVADLPPEDTTTIDTSGTGFTGINQTPVRFTLYPNPGNGLINIHAEGLPSGHITVTALDLLGRTVDSWEFESEKQLQHSSLSVTGTSGVLFFRLSYRGGTIIRKYLRR